MNATWKSMKSMKSMYNWLFSTVKVTNPNPNSWYVANTVNGKFVDDVVQELGNLGFTFRNSGEFKETVKGVRVKGVRGTYTRQTGRFSRVKVKVYGGANMLEHSSSGMVVYHGIEASAVSSRNYGIPNLRIGVSSPSRKWHHIDVTTDIYGPNNEPPRRQYLPPVTAKEALAKVGLEARLASAK